MLKQKKLLTLALTIIMLLFILTGCASEPAEKTNAEEPVESGVTYIDQMDRTVTLNAPAERIVGTHNPSMNMVIVLDGNGSRIAGFGAKDKAFGLYELVAPEINNITQIGKGKEINMEEVLNVKPDLAILPVRMQGLISQFEELDIPVLVLNVEKYESITDAILLVGNAVGKEDRAEQIAGYIEDKVANIEASSKKAESKPRVLMLSGSSDLEVSTDAMLQNLMISSAGGESVTAGLEGDFWTEVNMEQILAWNPEIVLIPTYASYTAEDVLSSEKWANVDAVKNGKVYTFPSALEPWDYPTASSVLGLSWMYHTLHPEQYSYEDMMDDVDQFYEMVYCRTFSAEELGIKE